MPETESGPEQPNEEIQPPQPEQPATEHQPQPPPEQPPQPEQPPEQQPQPGRLQPEQPRTKGLRKFWPFSRRKAQPTNQEAQQFKREIDEEVEKIRPTVQSETIREILERGPKNIDEILEIVGRLDYKDFRYLELAKQYGEGALGKLKAFLAGESDFGIDQDDQIRRDDWNACAEAGRKALYTVLNRRTMAATGVAAVLGILTGGVGAAAGGVIFGSMAGRGAAEAISAITGKERGARKDLLIAEKERWYELKRLADELQKAEDEQKRADLMTQITDLYFKQGKNVVLKQLQLANERFESEKEGLDKLRNRLQTLGEIVGVGAGIAHSYLTGHFAPIDIDLWHKVKGQSLMHEVVKINDTWHFVFNEAEKAGFAHVLGEPAWKIGVATLAERGLPVLLAAFGASVYGARHERRTEKAEAEYQAKKEALQKEKVTQALPELETKSPKWTKEKLEKLAQEQGVILPEGPSKLPRDWESIIEKLNKYFEIDEKGEIKVDLLPKWQKVDANGNVILGKNGQPILARVVEVEPEKNNIVIINKYDVQGKTVYRPESLTLDRFLREYKPILSAKPSSPARPAEQQPQAEQPEAEKQQSEEERNHPEQTQNPEQ